jgi:hypothetical protein
MQCNPHLPTECSATGLSSWYWLTAGFRMEYATGIGVEGTYSNFRVLCQNIQVDDQSPFTRYDVTMRQHYWTQCSNGADLYQTCLQSTDLNFALTRHPSRMQVPCGHRCDRGGDCDRRRSESRGRAAPCCQPLGGQSARPATPANLLPVHRLAPVAHPAGAGLHHSRAEPVSLWPACPCRFLCFYTTSNC